MFFKYECREDKTKQQVSQIEYTVILHFIYFNKTFYIDSKN